jgi:hypothetical protein
MFDTTLTSASFCVNEANKCVYYCFNASQGFTLCWYVDGILMFETYLDLINQTKSFLSQNIHMKEFREVDLMLNIKILRDENGI